MEFEWETMKNINAIGLRRVCYTPEAPKAQTSVLEQRTYKLPVVPQTEIHSESLLWEDCLLWVIQGYSRSRYETRRKRSTTRIKDSLYIYKVSIRQPLMAFNA